MARSQVAPGAQRGTTCASRAVIAIALTVGVIFTCASAAPAIAAETSTSGTPEPTSSAPTSAASTPTVAGRETNQTVDFQACTQASKPPKHLTQALAQERCPVGVKGAPARGYLVGRLTLIVQNEANSAKPLAVTLLPNGNSALSLSQPAKAPVHLPGTPNLVGLKRSPQALGQGEVTSLVFRFLLAPGQPVSAVNGTIQVDTGSQTELTPITGALRDFTGIAVNPTSLTMDADDPTATVTLTGSDLVAFLKSGGTGTPSTVLHDDDGNSVEATLDLPIAGQVAASEDPNHATATVRLADSSLPAGKYTGKLPISNLSTDAPSVTLEADANKPVWIAILLVLLGVLIGGVVRRLVVVAQRRRLLIETLNQSLAAYTYIHKHVHPNGEDRTASWDLDDLLGGPPPYTAAESPKDDRLQGIPGLLASIRSARASTDLDEDADRVLDTVARIQRWLRLEPAAELLVAAGAERPSSPLRFVEHKWKDSNTWLGTRTLLEAANVESGQENEHKWEDSNTWLGTRTLLEAAKREPPDVKSADDLVARLLLQAEWHHHFYEAWQALSQPGASQDEAHKLWDLDQTLDDNDKTVLTRTPEEQDALEAKLSAFNGSFTPPSKPTEPGDCNKPQDFTEVDWDASPNLFTGWATLDAQSYGQLTRRAATSARALFWPDFLKEIDALGLRDLFWSLLVAGVASAAYILPKYSDTWGTKTDLYSAVVAGLIGNVAIDWIALPIFQSLRVRSSTPAPQPTTTAQSTTTSDSATPATATATTPS